MLKRIIRRLGAPRLDDPEADRRRRAIDRLDPVMERERLLQLAQTDPEPALRRHSVRRIRSGEDLLQLCSTDTLRNEAQARLTQLISSEELDPLALARRPACLPFLLRAVSRDEHWQPLLQQIDSERLLSELASGHDHAPVRRAAAERLRSPEALRRVERAVRERDRSVTRLMRERLEQWRELQHTLSQQQAQRQALLDELSHLLSHEDDPQAAERQQWLQEQFQQLEQAHHALREPLAAFGAELPTTESQRQRFQTLQAELQARLDQQRQRAAEAEAQAAETAALHQQQADVVEAMEALWNQMAERLANHPAPASERTALAAALRLEQQRWQSAADASPPGRELVQRQQRVAGQLEQLLAALNALDALPEPVPAESLETPDAAQQQLREYEHALQQLAWPAAIPEPMPVGQLRQALTTLQAHERSLRDQGQQSQARLGQELEKLETALANGRLKAARNAEARLGVLLGEVDAAPLAERLGRARQQLAELEDWQRYASAEKREQLVAAMSALADTEVTDPQARAGEVRALREQWNNLGPVERPAQALARRFNKAAEAAFAPCRDFFKARSERQQFNADNQQRICDELAAFLADYDWEQADWPSVARIYQHARREWRQFADVPPDQRRALSQRYHSLMRELRSHLAPRWQANLARKRELVAEAESLSQTGASETELKTLQQAWRAIDITPASEERKLWPAFRDACRAAAQARPQAPPSTTRPEQAPSDRGPWGALQLALRDIQSERDD